MRRLLTQENLTYDDLSHEFRRTSFSGIALLWATGGSERYEVDDDVRKMLLHIVARCDAVYENAKRCPPRKVYQKQCDRPDYNPLSGTCMYMSESSRPLAPNPRFSKDAKKERDMDNW